MNGTTLSIVIPTYNEIDNIVPLVTSIDKALGSVDYEVIIVDDDSPDLTWKRVEELSRERPRVRVIRRVGRRGLSSAVLEGFDQALGRNLGVMDADLSHDETILPELLKAVEDGAEMAVGSRRVPGGGATHWPWYRRFTSWGATLMARLALRVKISDPMSGFFVIKRELYDRCRTRLEPTGYKILLEIYCKGRPARVREVPFVFKDRQQGYSKLTSSVMRQYIAMVWRLMKADRPR